MVFEKGIFEVKVVSNMLILESSRRILTQKPHIITKKTRMYHTNWHKTNHNVETYRVKRKEEPILTVFKVLLNMLKYREL